MATRVFAIHDHPSLKTHKLAQLVTLIASRPQGWSGTNVTRDLASKLKWEAATVSGMLNRLKTDHPDFVHAETHQRRTVFVKVTPQVERPVPVTVTAVPQTADATKLLLNLADHIQLLTKQLDALTTDIRLLQERTALSSKKLDYIAGKVYQ